MNLLKILLTFATLLCAISADNESNIPIIGSVLGTITSASKGVINGVIGTIETVEHETFGIMDDVKQNFLKLIEEFRSKMQHGIVELGLPKLEPLTIEHADFDIKHEIGDFQGSLDNVEIENLSTFKVQDIKINLLQFKVILNLTFDELNIHGNYKINGEFGELVHVYGEGPFTATIRDIKTGVDLQIGFQNNVASVKNIHLTFALKNMTCHFSNLMGGGENEELFNHVIENLAPEAVQVLWPEMEPIITDTLKKEANEKLKTIPIEKILELFLPPKPLTE